VQKLRYRHIVPYKVFGKQQNGRATPQRHPIPARSFPTTDEHCDLENMLITDLKNLLMADKERMWRCENADVQIKDGFDNKNFTILCPDVEFEVNK
jgi:hypothetical protein